MSKEGGLIAVMFVVANAASAGWLLRITWQRRVGSVVVAGFFVLILILCRARAWLAAGHLIDHEVHPARIGYFRDLMVQLALVATSLGHAHLKFRQKRVTIRCRATSPCRSTPP
jgi:hypothetical protein